MVLPCFVSSLVSGSTAWMYMLLTLAPPIAAVTE